MAAGRAFLTNAPTDLRRWARAWASDILRRINAETNEEDDDERSDDGLSGQPIR
jgi:hypothetical protein